MSEIPDFIPIADFGANPRHPSQSGGDAPPVSLLVIQEAPGPQLRHCRKGSHRRHAVMVGASGIDVFKTSPSSSPSLS